MLQKAKFISFTTAPDLTKPLTYGTFRSSKLGDLDGLDVPTEGSRAIHLLQVAWEDCCGLS